MLTHLLPLLVALVFPQNFPAGSGSVSGRITLVKAGSPRPDASDAVVWIEGLRRSSIPGGVSGRMKSENKHFTPRVVVVSRHETAEFPNVDPIYHNVFSVSGGNRFDLGLYRSGSSKKQRFDEPGLVRVYCNIHPQMIGFVMVVDSDYAVMTGTDGSFRLEGVPPGSYMVKAWHEEAPEQQAIPVTVHSRADSPLSMRLDVSDYRTQPHKNKYGKDYPPPSSDDERY